MSDEKHVSQWDKFVDAVSGLGVTKIRDKKKLLLALFLLTMAVGLYYPAAKIIRFEFPLVPPAIIRFNVALYDPYDPFRGRYVAINVPRVQVAIARDADSKPAFGLDSRLYAVIEPDEKGIAKIVDLVKKPQAGKINLRLDRYSVYYASRNKDEAGYDTYYVSFPFNRFYMNEKLAPEAERVFMQVTRGGGVDGRCQIVVKIYRDGSHAIDGMEIDGISIHEFLRKEQAERKEQAMWKEQADQNESDIAESPEKDESGDIIFVPD